ncbi:MAG TPA: universal stress protein [Gaiellaceae bacterium]|nr:universal stress protein [Gaiellaceae bacterium]
MNTQQETIVVGVDGSEHGERALEWAVKEAGLRGARLRLVAAWHLPPAVYSGPGYIPTAGTRESFEEPAGEAAEVAAARARDAGVEADAVVREGQAAEVLVEEAANADMLVVGSRGHGGFTGLLLGSVSAQCAHHAVCPLVIVRPAG